MKLFLLKKTANYLGIPLNGKGIDWHMYVVQIKAKATKTLRFIKAAGHLWPTWIKIAIFKSFCRSQLDYAGPLFLCYLQTPGNENKDKYYYKHVDSLMEECLKFILNLSFANNIRNKTLTYEIAGLITYKQRLKELRAALHFHLDNFHHDNNWTRTRDLNRFMNPKSLVVRASLPCPLKT